MGPKSPSLHKFSTLLYKTGMNFTVGPDKRSPTYLINFLFPLSYSHIAHVVSWTYDLVSHVNTFAHTIPHTWKAPYLFLYFSTSSVYLSRLIWILPPTHLLLTRVSAFTLLFHIPRLSLIVALRALCYLFKFCLYY